MGTAVILVVLVIIVVFAVRSGIKHGKGEGGCCGGGSSVKEEKKVLTGDIIATKIVSIEGMHCENCKNSIEHQINRIDGASCEVNLKKKTAVIKTAVIIRSHAHFLIVCGAYFLCRTLHYG